MKIFFVVLFLIIVIDGNCKNLNDSIIYKITLNSYNSKFKDFDEDEINLEFKNIGKIKKIQKEYFYPEHYQDFPDKKTVNLNYNIYGELYSKESFQFNRKIEKKLFSYDSLHRLVIKKEIKYNYKGMHLMDSLEYIVNSTNIKRKEYITKFIKNKLISIDSNFINPNDNFKVDTFFKSEIKQILYMSKKYSFIFFSKKIDTNIDSVWIYSSDSLNNVDYKSKYYYKNNQIDSINFYICSNKTAYLNKTTKYAYFDSGMVQEVMNIDRYTNKILNQKKYNENGKIIFFRFDFNPNKEDFRDVYYKYNNNDLIESEYMLNDNKLLYYCYYTYEYFK